MSQDTVGKQQTSLKEILAKLRETNGILDASETKLNYLATNTPSEGEKSDASPSGDGATLDALNAIANSLARKANNIASHTNKIVGN